MMALRALWELTYLPSLAMLTYLLSLEHTRPTPTSRPSQMRNKRYSNSLLTRLNFV